jgi:hypothetical protein
MDWPLKYGFVGSMVLLLSLLGWAGPHKRVKRNGPADQGYVSALACANRFLHAWEIGDLETGMVLLSDRVRHAQNPDTFEEFFSSDTNRGFEIGRGFGARGRYRFPVVLVMTRGTLVRRKASEIVVIDTGKNDWAVDRLP